MKRKPNANPYRKGSRARKAALAYLAAHGITQPRALYPQIREAPEPVRVRSLILVTK
jgi:hypothetical protein